LSQIVPELPGFIASIDQVIYAPEFQAPLDTPYSFGYFVTIKNGSDRQLTLQGRKWILRSEVDDNIQVVVGDGVVGQFPQLAAGEEFSYNSRHFVAGRTVVEGSFFAKDPDGRIFVCRLPFMYLTPPPWA
jgi:ApaG protein